MNPDRSLPFVTLKMAMSLDGAIAPGPAATDVVRVALTR
jgi:riboflavin biosynthesis pyrimidine reductase